MRVLRWGVLLCLSLGCDTAQVYTAQDAAAKQGVANTVEWRYAVIVNRLLARDFDPTVLSDQRFVNTYTRKVMGALSQRLTDDVATALRAVGIVIALQGKFPADSAVGRGLQGVVDAATALGTNTDKARTAQLSADMLAALSVLLADDAARRALAAQGSFISTQLKGPPDLMATLVDEEFVNEILALRETQDVRQLVDIKTFFDETVRTMHVVLNDVELMTELSDPAIIAAAKGVLSEVLTLYRQLREGREDHDVNSVKVRVQSLLNGLSAQQLSGVVTFSEAMWVAARPVHFKNLTASDSCDSPAWQAVRDLDGNASLVNNLPEAAVTALQLCRLSPKNCDAWGEWGSWRPAANSVCAGEVLTQTRTRQRTCPVPCHLADCSTTDTEARDVSGKKVCVTEPVCEDTCDSGCEEWATWQSQAWWPLASSVCEGKTLKQRKSRAQRRTCPDLCAGVECPMFQIIAPLRRTVAGTGNCPAPPPPPPPPPEPTCKCCDTDNNEITACPSNSDLAWHTDTCSCGACRKEIVMTCGGVYSSGKLYDDRVLDEDCACYYKTDRNLWASAVVYGDHTGGKELLDTACALRNVAAFRNDDEGRRIRTVLWDEGCVTRESLEMGCTDGLTQNKPDAAFREKFIAFHNPSLTRQTADGYWGLGCRQVFRSRQSFERRMMSTMLKCEHTLSDAAWEQIGRPPHFDRLYKKTHSIIIGRDLPEWGMHLKICESDYQINRPDRIENDDD